MTPHRRWEPWRFAATVVVATRIAFLTVAYSATWLLASTRGRPTDSFLEIWRRWDAVHLLGIAQHGYASPLSDPHATEWWPLFPLLVRGLTKLGIGAVAAGMLISAAASVVAFAFLYRLAEEELGEGTGRRAVLYLALFPTGVFLVAPYTEALFLAGAISAFYFARRGRWLLVGPGAAVAMGSRFPGAFLLLGLAVELLRQRDFSLQRLWRAAAGLGVGVLPFVGYAAFLQRLKGDPFYFSTDGRLGWARELVGPVRAFRTTWQALGATGSATNFLLGWRIEMLAAAVGLAAIVVALVKREWGYAAFMGSFVAALASMTYYLSIPRMVLTLFPIPLFLASFTRDRQMRHEVTLMILAPLCTLGVIVYTRGAWFF